MLHNYKHIVWDWNGTLLDDAWLCVEVLNQMLSQRGRAAITLEFYRQHFKFPVIDSTISSTLRPTAKVSPALAESLSITIRVAGSLNVDYTQIPSRL